MKDAVSRATHFLEITKIREYYNKRILKILNKHFDNGIEYYYLKRLLEPALKKINITDNSRRCRIADIGTGIGWPLYLLHEYIICSDYIVGVDISEALVKIGRSILFKNPLLSVITEYVIGDMFNMPFRDKGFSIITAFGAFEYVSKAQMLLLLESFKTICKDNCTIVYTVRSSHYFRRSKTIGYGIPIKKYSVYEIKHVASRVGFNIVAIYTTLHLNTSIVWRIYWTIKVKISKHIAKIYSRLIVVLENIVAMIVPKSGYTIVVILSK